MVLMDIVGESWAMDRVCEANRTVRMWQNCWFDTISTWQGCRFDTISSWQNRWWISFR